MADRLPLHADVRHRLDILISPAAEIIIASFGGFTIMLTKNVPWVGMLVTSLTVLMGVLGFASASMAEEKPFQVYTLDPICTGTNGPLGVDLNIFMSEGEALGYLRLHWYRFNKQLRPDQNVILDVRQQEPDRLQFSTLRIADDPYNAGVTGTISGKVGQPLTLTLMGPGWQCSPTEFEPARSRAWSESSIRHDSKMIREARSICTVGRATEGPTDTEFDKGMRAAAAWRLCNPTDLLQMASLQALAATGTYQFIVVDDACQARMFSVPIMNMIFVRSEDRGGCEVDASGQATCSAQLNLHCQQVPGSMVPNTCPQRLGTIDTTAVFKYDADKCKWSPVSFSVVGN